MGQSISDTAYISIPSQQYPKYILSLNSSLVLMFSEFRDFFKFVFQFSREGTNKTLEKELVVGLLPILLDINRAPHLEHFLQFLETISHPRINLDEWSSFLQFNQTCSVDLEGYDEDGAWPVLLDDYVTWRREQQSK